MGFIFKTALKAYRLFLSPLFAVAFGVRCRYAESCSCYAERMISEKGVLRAIPLSVKRILSCSPYTSAGTKELYGK